MFFPTNHTQEIAQLHKRPAEPSPLSPLPAKRRAPTPQPLPQLTVDLLAKIFAHLSHSQQRPLQTVCKDFSKGIWKQRKIEEDIDFYWNDCTFPCKEKGSYCLTKATFAFTELIVKHDYRQPVADFKLRCQSFLEIAETSPSFLAFSLQEIALVLKKYGDPLADAGLDCAHSWCFYPATAGGGEMLVYALMKLREVKKGVAQSYPGFVSATYQAIAHNATCVSYLAMRLLGQHSNPYYFKQFAFASAERGDYKALDQYYTRYSIGKDNKPPHNQLPPVLFILAKEQSDPKCAEDLYERALQGYRHKIPPGHLAQIARCKIALGKHLEAEQLFNKSLSLLGDNAPPSLLLEAAQLELMLSHNFQAQVLINRFIAANCYFDSAEAWAKAGAIALQLSNWEQAALLYKRALLGFKNKAPLTVIEQASTAFTQAGDYPSILLLYESVKNKPKRVLSPKLLIHTAYALLYYKDVQGAAALCDQAIAAYGPQIKEHDLLKVGKLLLALEKWDNAALYLNHYHQLHISKAEPITQDDLLHIAISNLKTKNWGKAAELYNQIIALHPQAPISMIQDALLANRHAENYHEMGTLLERLNTYYLENALPIPLTLMADIAHVKLKLEDYPTAAGLYEQILAMVAGEAAPILLADAALAHQKTANLQRAEQLYDQALAAFGDNVPLDILERAALVYYERENWPQASALFEKIQATLSGMPEHLIFLALHSFAQQNNPENYFWDEVTNLTPENHFN